MDNASFITQAESIALMQESSYCTYHPTHETSTLLKSFSFSFFFFELKGYIKKGQNMRRILIKGFIPSFGGALMMLVRDRRVPKGHL